MLCSVAVHLYVVMFFRPNKQTTIIDFLLSPHLHPHPIPSPNNLLKYLPMAQLQNACLRHTPVAIEHQLPSAPHLKGDRFANPYPPCTFDMDKYINTIDPASSPKPPTAPQRKFARWYRPVLRWFFDHLCITNSHWQSTTLPKARPSSTVESLKTTNGAKHCMKGRWQKNLKSRSTSMSWRPHLG